MKVIRTKRGVRIFRVLCKQIVAKGLSNVFELQVCMMRILQVGELSGVVDTDSGVHIIKRTA